MFTTVIYLVGVCML